MKNEDKIRERISKNNSKCYLDDDRNDTNAILDLKSNDNNLNEHRNTIAFMSPSKPKETLITTHTNFIKLNCNQLRIQ